MAELRLINTYDQLVAAGGGVAIFMKYTQGRSSRACGWQVYQVDAKGREVLTNKGGPWYEYGRKTFYWSSTKPKLDTLEEIKTWIEEHLGEHGPWKRNPMRDYVPERIAKQFPIRRPSKTT
jgi:hypothetical protein